MPVDTGRKQMTWFETTLKECNRRFRFVCTIIRRRQRRDALNACTDVVALGPGTGTGQDSALMKAPVQIFFYGHDHVFVDDIVDGFTTPCRKLWCSWKFTKGTGYERFWPDFRPRRN